MISCVLGREGNAVSLPALDRYPPAVTSKPLPQTVVGHNSRSGSKQQAASNNHRRDDKDAQAGHSFVDFHLLWHPQGPQAIVFCIPGGLTKLQSLPALPK
eukprot:1719131-Amphidinium_carterae.2